jgi:hypothetical protein
VVRLPKEIGIAEPVGDGIRKVVHTEEGIEIEIGSGSYLFTS